MQPARVAGRFSIFIFQFSIFNSVVVAAEPLTYSEWKLNHPLPGWLLALLVLAGAAVALFFYLRQPGLTFTQRVLWSAFRTGLLAALLLLLLDPIAISEHAVPLRKSALVLCDASLSMSVKDARHSDSEVEDAALALGLAPYPASACDRLLQRALKAAYRAGKDLNDHPAAAMEAQAWVEATLHDLSAVCPAEARPAVNALKARQKQLQTEEKERGVGRSLAAFAGRQRGIAGALEQLALDLREPFKCDAALRSRVQVSRIELLKGILSGQQLRLLERLQERCDVSVYRFGESLQRLSVEQTILSSPKSAGTGAPDQPTPQKGEGNDGLKELRALDNGTALGSAITEALERHSGQPVAGIVLFTDGAVNKGLDPVEAARRAGKAGTPVFPVGLGIAETHDVILRQLTAQEVAHVGDEMRVRVQFESPGYLARQAEVVLKLGNEVVARQKVTLNGALQVEELRLVPQQTGAFVLEAAIPPFEDESNKDNNAAQQSLRVTDERVKVLYIEGSPRWEYRYLRQVLLRDARLDVKFVMTEGDPELPKSSDRYLAEFPHDPAEAYKFDLVILGDVNPEKWAPGQLERIEELVRKRGASLLMIAGHFYAPRGYVGTPVEKVLPVELSSGAWMLVPPSLKMRLTPEGERSAIMRLDDDSAVNQSIWSLVSPMYELPRLGNAKSGATVLATVSLPLLGAEDRGKTYPLLAWQRYGTGKAMYVGTDQLWRLRFKRGDRYHARFWSQAIQVLTFSRLLGENKRICIETDQPEYQLGVRVQITANVHNEMFEPLKEPQFNVEAQEQTKGGRTRTVTLQAVPDTSGLYRGYFQPAAAGVVSFTAQGPAQKDSNTVEVSVLNKPLELQQTEMQVGLLREMAEQSGGRFFPVRELPALPEWLCGEELTGRVRSEKKLALPLFLAVLFCAGLEWFFRRRNDLC